MIQILTGENEFAIKKSIQKIKSQFVQKAGSDFGITKISASDGLGKLKDALKTNSFFSDLRLIIISDFLKLDSDSAKKTIEVLKNIDRKTIVILYNIGKTDKRKTKTWEKSDFKIKELSSDINISRFITQKIAEDKIKISVDAKSRFLQYLGNDFFRAENELEKLKAYSLNREISAEDVEQIVSPAIDSSIFNLIDAIGAKNTQRSLNELNKLLINGENEIYILTMIVYGFRNIILVKSALKAEKSNYKIASKIKMHPFVVSKTMAIADKFSFKDLQAIYDKLLSADLSLKTGKQEPKLLLEMLVSYLSR